MSDEQKYVPAPTEPGPRHLADATWRLAEAIRQQFIKEHHDLISPWLFSNRERTKRSMARFLRNYGEANLRRNQEAK